MRADLLIARVLCEDRMPALHKKWVGKLNTDHDIRLPVEPDDYLRMKHDHPNPTPHFLRSAAALTRISQMDPTPNKEYTDRLASWYHKGQFRVEDHPRVNSVLKTFHTLRRGFGPEHAQQAGLDIKNPKDIGSYKSLHDMEQMVRTHSQTGRVVLSPEEHGDIERGSKVIHDSPKLRVREIHTQQAACALGKGTEWCTAHPDEQHNRFNDYNRMGKLYHIHDKETGEVHQVHFESGQIMDKHDKDADVAALAKKHPQLVDLFHGRHAEIFTDRKRLLRDVAKDPQTQIVAPVVSRMYHSPHHEPVNAGAYLGRSSKDPDELHQIALHGNAAAQLAVANNDLTQSHTLEHLSNGYAKVAEHIANHHNASARALSNVVNTVNNIGGRDYDHVLADVGVHKNTDVATRLKLMQSANTDVVMAALHGSRSADQDQPPMDKHPELLDAAVKHPSSTVQADVAWSKRLTADHMRQMTSDMKKLSGYPAKILASRKDLPVDVQHKLATHWDDEVHRELLANKHLHPEVVTKLSQSRSPSIVARSLYHHNLPDEARMAAVKKNPNLAGHAAEYQEYRSNRRLPVTWRNFGGGEWEWMD